MPAFNDLPGLFASECRSQHASVRLHEEASVKTEEQDELGTSQTSIRHHPQSGAP